jgi:glycolate oxidase FAD binding subunit
MSAVTDSAVSRLESVLGANAIFTAKAANRELYAIDGVAPTALAKPASVEQAGEIIRFAAKEKLSIIPVGARTKLFLAAAPPRYDVALDLTALDEVAHYDPADLTVSVGTGMPLSKLNAMLQQQNQFLPLQVPYYSQCTIGGAIASGLDSAMRNAYGTARDFLLGAEFIDGLGAQIKSGGRVVKNVTGYDLHKLLVGSFGTLAAITRLNFRTFPIPATPQGFLATFPTHEAAFAACRKITHSPLAPLTLEIINPQASRILFAPAQFTPACDLDHWQLFAEFAGNDDLLARYKRDLTALSEQSQATQVQILEDDKSLAAITGRLREFIALARESFSDAVIVKLSTLPAHHIQTITVLQSVADAANAPLAIVARASGPIYVAVHPGANPPAPKTAESTESVVSLFAQEIVALARSAAGGRAQLISAPLQHKSQLHALFAGLNSSDHTLLKKIKFAFDPQNTFPPLSAPSTPPAAETSRHAVPSSESASQTTRLPTPPSPPPSKRS